MATPSEPVLFTGLPVRKPIPSRHAVIVVGLGYGDETKGSIVDYYTRYLRAHTVIRFNGGGQAAHNVVDPDGRHHTFSQFGSGTLVPGVKTHLSKHVIVDPLALMAEESHLRSIGITDAIDRLTIDPSCIIVTPYHRVANRITEYNRAIRHGSCGLGIGEAVSDWLSEGVAIRIRDLRYPYILREKLTTIKELKHDRFLRKTSLPPYQMSPEWREILDSNVDEWVIKYAKLAEAYPHIICSPMYLAETILSAPGTVIFEGAQGVLLDETYGFHPYTTWSTTTTKNARQLLIDAKFKGKVTTVGLTRAYATRHGAGPFVSWRPDLKNLSGEHNIRNPWQQDFRIGWLDLVALRYALSVCPVDSLALTCLDHLPLFLDTDVVKICSKYKDNSANGGFLNSGHIIGHTSPSIGLQQNLTNALMHTEPDFTTIQFGELFEFIREHLQIPIGITSHGLRADGKVVNDDIASVLNGDDE